MPAPGAQYTSDNIKNPFDERRVNDFTAQEIASLQARLNQQLGPEYISHRSGAGGSKVAYLEGTKAIALANDVFGFNGWSSSLQQVQIDYVDEQDSGRVNLGLSIIVRVTLKDGTYHEDIGYGTIDNAKGKGAAFEKAKKEAATDGLKRALRNFGNVLGNCLYDKEYLKKVTNVKIKPPPFDESRLYRHENYRPQVKKEEERAPVKQEQQAPLRAAPVQRSITNQSMTDSNVSVTAEFDDEFGGDLFDGVDISENQADEFSFGARAGPSEPVSRTTNGQRNTPPDVNMENGGSRRPPIGRMQSLPPQRAQNGVPAQNNGPPRPAPHPVVRAPQTPNFQQNNGRPDMHRRMNPTVDIHASRPPPQPQQNQPQRATPPQNPQMENHAAPSRPNSVPMPIQTPINLPSGGFVTSRAAELLQNADSHSSIPNVPTFDPKVDSPLPKHMRTPGIDHNRSQKITRESVGVPTAPIPPPPALPLPQQQQQPQPGGNQFRPVGPVSRGSFVNPHHDPNRRIGMPGVGMSPLANRNAYKPPGMAGGIKRPPLADVSNQTAGGDGAPDPKKARLEDGTGGGGMENAQAGAVGS